MRQSPEVEIHAHGEVDAPRGDTEVLDEMLRYHRVAVWMADQVIARGERPEVKQAAEALRAAETMDIGEVEVVRKAVGLRAPAPDDFGAKMAGLREAMSGASGAELDSMFINNMVAHHARALIALKQASSTTSDERVKALAADVAERDTAHLERMLELQATP